MPELTGPEMVAQLKQRWPDLSVLFVTGFAGDASEIASFGDHDVLRKPFTLAALDQAIRRSSEPREGQRPASSRSAPPRPRPAPRDRAGTPGPPRRPGLTPVRGPA